MSDPVHIGRRRVLSGIGAVTIPAFYKPHAGSGPDAGSCALLTHGGIIDLFDRRFSVDDTAKRHKPAPEAYAEVTSAPRVSPSEMCLIACHTWNTMGARSVGWEAGLIRRVNNDVLDTTPQPEYVGNDLNAIADQIIARHGPEHG